MNIIYEAQELEGERLVLDSKEDIYFLGPDLTLRDCTLVTRVPARWLHILPTRFINCTIQAKQELKNLDWSRAFLKGCRFTGRLTGCDFGRWPLDLPGQENGFIEDCDFSEARLDGCRFHGCDTRTLRFPPWPCFTILHPVRSASELATIEWPGNINSITLPILARQLPSTVAVTWYAPIFAKQSGTTPEELRGVLERFDCIVY
jgi:hypothetical protein